MHEVHIPVLKEEIRNYFSFPQNTLYLDCTVGLGGHLIDFLTNIPSLKEAVGIDMDTGHLQIVEKKLEAASLKNTHVNLVHSRFEYAKDVLASLNKLGKVTSVLLDLGICSTHVDKAERGFSFRQEGPLDMRFDRTRGISAADIIESYSEKELSDIFYLYGEERRSREIASLIVDQRKHKAFETTSDLSTLIADHIPSYEKKHPATRVFQALRIAVNGELDQIKHIMDDMLEILAPGGRVAVISYHSLEDRIVKQSMKQYAKACICPPSLLRCVCGGKARMNILTKKPILPQIHEINENIRSRSAKLRIAEKISL